MTSLSTAECGCLAIADISGGTTAAIRGQRFEGEQAEAWRQLEPMVVGMFEQAGVALAAAISAEAVAA